MGWLSGLLFDPIKKALFGDPGPAREAARKAAAEAERARKEAADQAAATAKQQTEYQKALLAIQQEQQTLASNQAVDLRTDVVSNVVAAGTADAASAEAIKKKKQPAPSMAAQLGINV